MYLEKIRKAKTIEEVEKIKEELLKLNEQKPDEQTPQNPSNPQNPDDSSNPKDSSKNPKEKIILIRMMTIKLKENLKKLLKTNTANNQIM
ncbi:albumin-binding GA domain-containing protein [Anaerococcus obesiensis]|uniref:albumin-binding GA domain-containing protein n=1 Tax=Anaerococcus obesiensis TaxID=1287640 RepID=UPI001F3DD275|nr:albumin-binding GA domain-containing protein [Anaerococcus obesiensis]